MIFEQPDEGVLPAKQDIIPAPETALGVEAKEAPITPESIFGKSLRCFKKWGTMGVAVGALLVAAKFEKQLAGQDQEWRDHVSSSLTETEKEKMQVFESQIREFFGDDALHEIENGDRAAFFERKENERKSPEISGFMERGWVNMHTYVFTEGFKVYPKGWVNGEVGSVQYVDTVEDLADSERRIMGEFGHGRFSSKPVMHLYRNSPQANDDSVCPVQSFVVMHEFGHANDWECDMDLSIVERQDLLLRVHERVISDDTYHRENDQYHETFMDGSQEGLYRAVKEYWADICAEYFSNPAQFQEEHPKDFDLVNEQATKNDPTFNVFDENRGAFDPTTGKLRQIYVNTK